MEAQRNNKKRIPSHKFLIDMKKKLIDNHGCRCGYCNIPLFGINSAVIDNYFPKAHYGEEAWAEENLVLACYACNLYKRDIIPVSEQGNVLILHPYKAKYSDHMAQSENGELIGITEEGRSTINLMHLNRSELINYRINNPNALSIMLTEPLIDPFYNYDESIKSITELLETEPQLANNNTNSYFLRLLFASVISTMEAFLSNTILTLISYNENLKWQCVERLDWNKEKVEINRIREVYLDIDTKLISALQSVLYHNIPKVKAIYKSCFNIEIFSEQKEMEYMIEAISTRHNIVHRNGRKPIGKSEKKLPKEYIAISRTDVEVLICHTNKLKNEIEGQIKTKGYLL